MKRFTETNKWDDPWFRKLAPKQKCLWQYLCDRCDPAGVIDLDFELASCHIGAKIAESDLLSLNSRIYQLPSGKYLIPKFLLFQYGTLSDQCPAHKKVIQLATSYGLLDESKGLRYPSARVTVTQLDMDKDKEEDKKRRVQGGDKARPQTSDDVLQFCRSLNLPDTDADYFWNHWQGNGFTNGGKPIKDWKATIRSWESAGHCPSQKEKRGKRDSTKDEDAYLAKKRARETAERAAYFKRAEELAQERAKSQ